MCDRSTVLAAIAAAGIALAGVPEITAGTAAVSNAQPDRVIFDKPIWDSSARFEMRRFAGAATLFCSVNGDLDGPAAEVELQAIGNMVNGYVNGGEGGKTYYSWYDPASGRAHRVGGNGWGYLDGPLSRARFGSRDYGWGAPSFQDKEGHFLYVADSYNNTINLRRIDFDRQVVTTVIRDLKWWGPDGFRGAVPTTNGAFLMLRADGRCETVDGDTGKVLSRMKCELPAEHFAGGTIATFRNCPIAMDEVHGRLYAGFSIKAWWVWYWDLKDGSFHGVMPRTATGLRPKDVPGPFEGTAMYDECGQISFGPDDPERRFLYMTRVDTMQLFRLDFQKREIAALTVESSERGKPAVVCFSTEKGGLINAYYGHEWLPDGTGFVSITHSPQTCWMFKRIK